MGHVEALDLILVQNFFALKVPYFFWTENFCFKIYLKGRIAKKVGETRKELFHPLIYSANDSEGQG